MKKSVIAINESSARDHVILSLLLVLSALCRFPFILKGYGDTDTASIAVSTIDFIKHGESGFLTTFYFLDVVSLYSAYIKFVVNFFNVNYQYLPVVMNYTTAFFGTLIIVPAYLFTKRLFNNNTIAFCTAITFAFAPSIYQGSIYGFPSLPALFFFLAALHFFLVWLDTSKYTWFVLSAVALATSILLKNDLILGCGAFFGLLYVRRKKEIIKIASPFAVIALSFVTFLLIRQWLTGVSKGYTTSFSGFIEWFLRFFNPLLSKSAAMLIKHQIAPIVCGIGVLSFFTASIIFIYYLIRKRSDIIVFVLAWSACPTILWIVNWNNNARHNMQSILPFLIIIFYFLYEKFPKFTVVFPVILILGNFLITPPSVSIKIPSGNLLKSQELLDNKVNTVHLIARKIAEVDDDKLIFTTEGFRPYLLHEVISLTPEYKLIDMGSSCYRVKNAPNECVICFYMKHITHPIKYIKNLIAEHQLEDYTIIVPFLDLKVLEEEGLKKIDSNDMKTWVDYKGLIPYVEFQ